MTVVNVLEAKTHLSRLIAEVEAGGEVIIARHNRPVVRLVPAEPAGATAPSGLAEPALAWQAQPAAMPYRMAGPAKRWPGTPSPPVRRTPGRLKGIVAWDDRFNDPLPDDELRLWNGEGD